MASLQPPHSISMPGQASLILQLGFRQQVVKATVIALQLRLGPCQSHPPADRPRKLVAKKISPTHPNLSAKCYKRRNFAIWKAEHLFYSDLVAIFEWKLHFAG